MSVDQKAIAIGLTAPFGSGCTTVARMLENRRGYKQFRLSAGLSARWKADHDRRPTRTDLQQLGNELREGSRRAGILAEEAINTAERAGEIYFALVFDGIRNTGEIEILRERFGRRFFLFAIDCPAEQRWERLREEVYERQGRTKRDFLAEDENDKNQEYEFGQQVQLCVDEADVLLENDNQLTQQELWSKTTRYVDLVEAKKYWPATAMEVLMNIAYSMAHGSKCLKRQVGAVIVRSAPGEMGEVVGQGFNENPLRTAPCVEEPEYGADPENGTPGRCYRDIVRHQSFVDLAEDGARCPKCGELLLKPENVLPPWRCNHCSVDLERFYWPERALTLCTAVHAEAAAISSSGRLAEGATLYTTTFPCFQCAEKITQAGIENVIFTEPYPDVRAAARLEIAGIKVARFEGVRSRRFNEIFNGAKKAEGR